MQKINLYSKEGRARLVLFGACLAVFSSAFEVRQPLLDFGVFNLTTSKLAAIFFFLTAIAWVQADGIRNFISRRSLDVAVLLFLASNFLSVTVAVDKAGAFKFALRMLYAVGIYFGISRLPRRLRPHLVVAGTVTVTVLLVSFIGLLENFVIPMSGDWLLRPFQEGVTTFGAFYNKRVSSTLPFPTTLSMYLELAMPVALVFGLWLTLRARESSRRWWFAATSVGVTAIMAVQLYTYTRSGLIAAPVSLVVGAVLAASFGYGRRVWIALVLAVALLLVILGASALLSEKMAIRLGLEEQVNRYGAQYTLVSMPSSLQLNNRYSATVRIKNTGSFNWSVDGDNEVNVSYRWVKYQDGLEADVPFLSTVLPHEVPRGGEAELNVDFLTPSDPGQYILDFDLVHVHVSWFSAAGVGGLQVPVEIDANGSRPFPVTEPASKFDIGNPEDVATPRTQFWRAAIKTWRDHPLLGIGPDQFRNRYTDYLDVTPDSRFRTHEIFLEALANTGIVGLAVMVFLLGSAGFIQLRLIRDRAMSLDKRLLSLGLFIALVAYVGHGLFDCFLWQTGVAFLFFTLLGLTAWLDQNRKLTDPE